MHTYMLVAQRNCALKVYSCKLSSTTFNYLQYCCIVLHETQTFEQPPQSK